ncbi:MAG: hypothetical protein IBX63_10030 [Coriobacteriia bacterium]|nr:hypothetical protein [Coriobacteriia bacterium]
MEPEKGDITPLDSIGVEGREGLIPVLLHSREGNTLFVRELDPGETAVPIEASHGVDRIVLMTSIHSTAVFQSAEVGADDSLTGWLRVVFDGQEGDTVYARTLRRGEVDDGSRVHLKPGQRLGFMAGSCSIDLEDLDERFSSGIEEYPPLANTVWTWLSIGNPGERDEGTSRYLIAAARRLDAAAGAWERVTSELPSVEELAARSSNPTTRARIFRLVADVEIAVIALRRVVDMVERAQDQIAAAQPVPDVVARHSGDLKEIRDAFEHIDERALGRVRKRQHPSATSIFEQHRLLDDHVIAYSGHEVSFEEVFEILKACRRFLLDVAARS